MNASLIPLLWLGCCFLALFLVAELLYRVAKVRAEYTRKLVHAGTGVLTLLFPVYLSELWQAAVLCGAFLLLLIISLQTGWLPSINAVERKTAGSWLYPIIVLLCFAFYRHMSDWPQPLFTPLYYFYTPLLLLAFCDPVAALAGAFWKKRHPATGPGKTFAGSFSFFGLAAAICIVSAVCFTKHLVPTNFFVATGIATAFAATLTERFSDRGWDNFTIPASRYALPVGNRLRFMSAAFRILKCRPDDALFSEVLRRIYPNDASRHIDNELDSDDLLTCVVLLNGTAAIGRLAIFRNPAMMHLGKPTAQFGAFECIDDAAAARMLIEAGLNVARESGAQFVIGPMNGSTWNQYRFITLGGDTPQFFTEHTHPVYYPALWRQVGFVAFQHYVSNLAPVPERDAGDVQFFSRHGLTVRDINSGHLQEELESLYPLCVAAFSGNNLYTPISREKFVSKLIGLKPLLSDGLTKIVTRPDGVPLAFALCLPDVLNPSGKTTILKTAAKHPDCGLPGLMSELYRLIMVEARRLGYDQVIHAFMHVDNRSLRRSEDFAGSTFRQYTLYIRNC